MILGSHATPARGFRARGKPKMLELSLLEQAIRCPSGLFPRPALALCIAHPSALHVWEDRKRRKR